MKTEEELLDIIANIFGRVMPRSDKIDVIMSVEDSVRRDYRDPEQSYHSIKVTIYDNKTKTGKFVKQFIWQLTDTQNPVPGRVIKNIIYEIEQNSFFKDSFEFSLEPQKIGDDTSELIFKNVRYKKA